MDNLLKWLFPSAFFEERFRFRWFEAGVFYTLLLVLQLFTYEKFYGVVASMSLPGGEVVWRMVAILLPVAELLAIPYLLSMRLPNWLSEVSRVAIVTAPAIWLLISLWQNLSGQSTQMNTGLLGATVASHVGWWFTGFALLWLYVGLAVVFRLPGLSARRQS